MHPKMNSWTVHSSARVMGGDEYSPKCGGPQKKQALLLRTRKPSRRVQDFVVPACASPATYAQSLSLQIFKRKGATNSRRRESISVWQETAMRKPAQCEWKVAAIGCALVLLVAGTARLFHASIHTPLHHEKPVFEASSPLFDHPTNVAASPAYAPPVLAMLGAGASPEQVSLPQSTPLRRGSGRAPPA
ncbi:MAG TPA: hypothetical protein VK466_14260 [Terriglobales bacterium]|nr:hypothetical protein [Terriglobales bacterium]